MNGEWMTSSLLWLILVPVVGALLCTWMPERWVRWQALIVSLVGLVQGLALYVSFDAAHAAEYALRFSVPWVSAYGIDFSLGVDGLSFPLIVLSKLMMPVAILASWGEKRWIRGFLASFFLLDSAMVGTFLATDIFLFYVFWEAMLIPMLLIIGIWGSAERVYAAVKFFLYTFAGSVLMLVAIFWLLSAEQSQFGAFSGKIADLYRVTFPAGAGWLGLNAQDWIFLAFTIAFLIKVPLFPLHTWLPDAHVQAPTGGSILLAAVLLKMGTYGILRFSIPIAPQAFVKFAPILAGLSLVGILYGAWVAFQQTDMKKLVAYSSVSHLAFVVLGICAINTEALTGAVLQMINHGLSTGALFFLVGALYERRHSRNFADLGGLAAVMPWFSVALVFVAASSMGVPGLNGFVGEFLILFGVFRSEPIWASVAVLGVIFGAVYTLALLRRVLFGPLTHEENKSLPDLSLRDWAGLVPLCALIIWLGVQPRSFLNRFSPALDQYWKVALKERASESKPEKTAWNEVVR